MTEDYLQFIWRHGRLPTNEFLLTDGRSIQILSFGFHNTSRKGPDFSFGAVLIDGIEHFGPIEIHINSSDWIKHNHQSDPLYQSVILHVVFQHDCDIIANGTVLPTLELKNHVDNSHLLNFSFDRLKKTEIPCQGSFSNVAQDVVEQTKRHALELKVKHIFSRVSDLQGLDTYAVLLARALGMSVNSDFLEQIVRDQLPPFHLNTRKSFAFSKPLHESTYLQHHCGTRPGNFPEKRIIQIEELLKSMQELSRCTDWKSFKKELAIINRNLINRRQARIGLQTTRSLFLNAQLPYLLLEKRISMVEYRKELLTHPPESNNYLRKWGSTISINNAFDSHGLYSLYRYKCSAKKCLTCSIGRSIIRKIS